MNAMGTEVRKKHTYADLENIPPDGRRYEILAGELLVSPSPGTDHQLVAGKIYGLLLAYSEIRGGIALIAPADVLISDADVLQPDVLYLSSGRAALRTKKNVAGAPDLVVEVLSPGTEHVDRGEKLRIYKASGVREYWIVDPDERFVELHDFPASMTVLLNPGQRLDSKAVAGFSTDVAEFFSTLQRGEHPPGE